MAENPDKKSCGVLRYSDVQRSLQERAPQLFEILFEKAKDGDLASIKEYLDRAYGRAPQSIDIGGAGGGPVAVDVKLSPELAAALGRLTVEETRK
ncbi:MAG: hypothetical protein LBC94_00035 [Desulfovibrio sp.]|jgi:hypothetical protein|nr:hypothetical protein [Desulfovibrio sp.]